VTDVTAPSSWLIDLQIPSILRRWDGRFRPTPVRVPELAPTPVADPSARERVARAPDQGVGQIRASVGPAVLERNELRTELVALKRQIPSLRRERDRLQVQLIDLRGEIPALRQERDELLATAVPLSAEVSQLESKQDELISLRSEIQALRVRKTSLEKSLAGLRGPTESARRGRTTDNRKFHDS